VDIFPVVEEVPVFTDLDQPLEEQVAVDLVLQHLQTVLLELLTLEEEEEVPKMSRIRIPPLVEMVVLES
jgi:hypothetical protein